MKNGKMQKKKSLKSYNNKPTCYIFNWKKEKRNEKVRKKNISKRIMVYCKQSTQTQK